MRQVYVKWIGKLQLLQDLSEALKSELTRKDNISCEMILDCSKVNKKIGLLVDFRSVLFSHRKLYSAERLEDSMQYESQVPFLYRIAYASLKDYGYKGFVLKATCLYSPAGGACITEEQINIIKKLAIENNMPIYILHGHELELIKL